MGLWGCGVTFCSYLAKKMTTRTGGVAASRAGGSGKRRRRVAGAGMTFLSAVGVLTVAPPTQITCAFSLTPTARSGFAPHSSRWSPVSDHRSCRPMLIGSAREATKSSNASAKPASVGQQIQQAADVDDLLAAASVLWVPTDDDLPPHYCQEVHHEKRQRWAGQLLGKMGQIIPASFDASLWADGRLSRAIEAAAIPFHGRDADRAKVEGRAISESLIGLASIVGRTPPPSPFDFDGAGPIIAGVAQLISRAEGMANELELKDAVEVRWAARTLTARLPGLTEQQSNPISDLDARVSHLPFDIFPLGVEWPNVCNGEYVDQPQLVSTLRDAIPFNFDTITTRTGSEVIERRGTAWVADKGIGALAYSGKLMKPQPLPSIVSSAMRATEKIVLDYVDDDDATIFFDCALCNHYPDAEAACKFHTDPEHGSLWDRLTCVVSAGDDRRFAFRPIPERSAWGDWDSIDDAEGGNGNAPAVYHMFAGDIVKMSGRCNDDFWHAVYADDVATRSAGSGEGRVSLVFKRAIDRNGKRGHGLSGEGRRSKRRRDQGVNPTNNDSTGARTETATRRRKKSSSGRSSSSSTTSGKRQSAGRAAARKRRP